MLKKKVLKNWTNKWLVSSGLLLFFEEVNFDADFANLFPSEGIFLKIWCHLIGYDSLNTVWKFYNISWPLCPNTHVDPMLYGKWLTTYQTLSDMHTRQLIEGHTRIHPIDVRSSPYWVTSCTKSEDGNNAALKFESWRGIWTEVAPFNLAAHTSEY